MTILLHVLMALVVMSSILLVGVILLQRTRGGGMGLAFGAGMGEALFGAQAGNILTRITVVLATIFLGCTMLVAVIYARMGSSVARERALPPSEPPRTEVQPAGSPVSAPTVPEQPAQEKPAGQAPPAGTAGAESAPPKE